mgnify:CR=1 FL=1
MRAIVLSGGGAKGSYEIGVWKALRRLGIDYDIVTGTSVGALNGALMTQKTYLKALFLWYNLSYDDIFEISNDYNKEEILKFYKDNALKGGVDVSNLESTIKKCIKPDKFFKSNINFGLITVKVPSMKHVEITKKDLNRENLDDYLVASASCFPAFKLKKINDEYYIDGGFYDNLPINLAIKLGATEIIAVDLKEVGIKRIVKTNISITYIKPKNKIDSFLKFEKNSARRGIRLGFNDTMKLYKRLDGDKYTFKINNLKYNFNRYKNNYLNNIDNILKKNNKINKIILENVTLKKIYKDNNKLKNTFDKNIEKLGYILDIDDSYIYSIYKYNRLIIDRFNKIDINLKEIEENVEKNKLKVYLNNKVMIKYLYELIKNNEYEEIKKLCLLFPNEFLMSIYIKTIKGE